MTTKANFTIRRTQPGDAQGLHEIFSHPHVYSNTMQLPHPNIEKWTKRLQDVPNNVYSYVAVITENGEEKVVGNLGFTQTDNPRCNHSGSFGMAVHYDYQGQGIGSALLATLIDLADNWLHIRRISLGVFTDNKSAIALYKKFGFIIEGEGVDYAYRNGEYVNVYFMARIKSS